jgi:hypothetical protein
MRPAVSGYEPAGDAVATMLVYPKAVARKPLPPGIIPRDIEADYREACLVLADSAKASAALSRRCLQTILREHAKVKHQDLSKEIDEVLASKQLPTYLANDIDAVRNYGNFAAHPVKSKKRRNRRSRARRGGVEPRRPRGIVRFLFHRPRRVQEEAGGARQEAH